MERLLTAKQLRANLPSVVERVRRGEQFVVVYRSRPAFRLVPVNDTALPSIEDLADEPLYRAGALGRSDGRMAPDHDGLLYGGKRR